MPEGSVPLLIGILILLIFSAFFSAVETAYSCANRIKLRTLSSKGDKLAGKVLTLAEEKFDKLISTVLICNNIVNITASTLSTLFFAMIITKGVDSSVVSTAVTTVAVLIFGEITPKFLAKSAPEKFCKVFYPIIISCYYIFYPVNLLLSGWKWLLGKVFKLKSTEIITEEEILTVVQEAAEDGTLKKDETKLIRSVIEFDDLEVKDILVPRLNVVAININSSMNKIKSVFEKEGYSRLPVYKNDIDTIIGIIHQKDFFFSYLNGKENVDDILQNAVYTTEHVKISALLKQLQKQRVHLAVVLDEYGGTLGVVTLEDILEELVGEIYDEHDEEINYFKDIDSATTIVDCNAPIQDMFAKFNLDGDEEKFEATTVNGWIVEFLGEIPLSSKKFEYNTLSIEVLKSTVRRVLQIKVTRLDKLKK